MLDVRQVSRARKYQPDPPSLADSTALEGQVRDSRPSTCRKIIWELDFHHNMLRAFVLKSMLKSYQLSLRHLAVSRPFRAEL